jgi:Immunoglobulin-like domain of bacterial spore germination/Sporulation and spore germination
VTVAWALAVLVALGLVAGCGGDSNDGTITRVRAYFLRDGHVWPVSRVVNEPLVDAAALTELFEGPTDEEQEELGATSAVSGGVPSLRIEGGVATFQPQAPYSTEALAQIVYTLTQFPEIESVDVNGTSYTRADFEEQTPSVLVESPLPFEELALPLIVSGTANTFEATFQYELVAPNGAVVFKSFVTATSGTGTRGTFEFMTDAVDHPAEGGWSLRVFELSAEDGSRIHEVEIPLQTGS